MAYDVALAGRVREALPEGRAVREITMFGGLAFMVDGKMAACVSAGGGALLVRVSAARDAGYLEVTGARRAEMGAGRSMGEGWIAVDRDALVADEDLRFWLDAVLEFNAEQTAPR
ncbi:TfoX/Sxy family protein [Blastococcus sp. SYSU DS0510]